MMTVVRKVGGIARDLEEEKRVYRMAHSITSGQRKGVRNERGCQGPLCWEAIKDPAGEGPSPIHSLKK